MKYIQSFYQYPVTFSSIAKTIPCKDAAGELRNICEITEEEIAKLEACEPLYRDLVNKKHFRILNKMPESYKPAATQINEAREAQAAAEARAAEAEAKLAALENRGPAKELEAPADDNAEKGQDLESLTYKELQDLAAERGIEYKNVKKADLIAALSK